VKKFRKVGHLRLNPFIGGYRINMKRKIFSVLFALVLVCSFSLVMAVPVAADTTGPVLASIAFVDADSSTDISGGDTLTFTFTEATAMLTSTITAANINTVLATSGGHGYGTADSGLMLAWDATLKVLTVTLGNDFDLVSGETVNPTAAVTDVMGNPDETVTPQTITDNVGPTLSSIAWTDVDSSKAISATDTLAFTFSEKMKTSTVTAANVSTVLLTNTSHTYGSGATVAWSAGDTVVTVTLGTALTIVSGDTVNPTNAVTDVADVADASSAVTLDCAMPTLSSIAWTDVDSSTDISATDTLVFTFSETMNASTVTAANVDTALPITGTGTTYGTTATAAWSTTDTVMTVTLGTGVDIVSGDTVNPAATVTDVADLADATTTGVAITDGIGPTLDSITWTDTDASTDISGTDTLAFTFSEAMATTTVTTANINVVLATSGTHTFYYGTVTNGLALSWSADGTVLTVTVGSDVEAACGETVNPTAAVTDVAGVADATAAGVALGAAQIWVDDDYSQYAYNDGRTWGTDAFATITLGIAGAAAGDTVNVLPGTYSTAETFPLQIDTAGVTLQSTGTAAETIIDATGEGVAIRIGGTWDAPVTTLGVTVDGFTVTVDSVCGIYLAGADDAIIQNNVVNASTSGGGVMGIDVSWYATGVTVSGNTVDEFGTIDVHGSDCTVSGNIVGRDIIVFPQAAQTIEGTIITDNTFPDPGDEAVNGAINLWGGDTSGSAIKVTLIEGNTLSNRDQAGIRIGSSYGTNLTVEDLTITGNTITNNVSWGIKIYDVESWGTGNTISNNNISGNLTSGIENLDAAVIDAESNWWGDASGPYQATTNSAGTGDAVDDVVDYRPWLTSAYSAPVAAVTTVSLSTGWNLISLPLYIPPANQPPATLLAGVTGVGIVWGDYDPSTGGWHTYVPGATNDLTAMRDGNGYWVNMTAADTLDVSTLGTELPEAPNAPPTYDVVVGWNLIGLKSTSATTASTYLAAIDGQYTIIYGFANGAYSVVLSTDSLEPGYGYWIAVIEAGTIYP